MCSIDVGNLVWTVAETKEMFQKYRLWPSFIGTNFDQERRASKGRLPVMIWPEQRRYLNERIEAQQTNVQSQSRKRKFDETISVNAEVPEISSEPSKKLQRSSILSRIGDLANKATSTINSVLGWMFGWKLASTENAVTNAGDASNLRVSSSSESTESAGKIAVDGNTGDDEEKSSAEGFLENIQEYSESQIVAAAKESSSSVLGFRVNSVSKRKIDGTKKISRKNAAAEIQMTIFRSLQEEYGYFIGPGDVYGGDYTIYRGGDPSNSHSTATVRVARQRKISARDLLSFSRVQNQVAKSAVIGFIDPRSSEAAFLVINFQNVSDRA